MSDKEEDKSKHEPNKSPVSARRAKKLLYLSEYLSKQESRINCKKVSKILKKSAHEHTEDEKATLAKHQDIVKRISKNKEKRKLNEQRVLEKEDSTEDLQNKCEKLAKIIQHSKKTVIYTGAGISTAASIPDYRGPQGVWTLLQKGEQLTPQDLSDAEPTLTHMCITQLHKLGHVKHVVSQNCDGLHMRSGLPRHVLSEVHGNMFVEICHNCRPHREYVRLFDVTENTGVRRHFTGRHCQKCGGKLKDTIVHFGEKGGMKSPYRWKEAVRAANKCDLILCLGSSLKILKKYSCLWCMDRVKHKRPKLVIVNLQWTPKDESATLKINGRCDDVLEKVMQLLKYSIPKYCREEDPIFSLATPLTEDEEDTTNKKVLKVPSTAPGRCSYGISRTPTPSDSSDSRSSLSSTDSCDTPTEWTNINMAERKISDFIAGCKSDCSTENHPAAGVSSEELFQSKSERICNEAKIAMQERLVHAKINEMYGECSGMQAGTFTDKPVGLNGLIAPGINQLDNFVEQQRKLQYDPLRGGPFDPGPVTHEEKLKYLQILQSQLDELKRKQKLLKEQEQQHLKQQRQLMMEQARGTSETKKQERKQQLKQEPKQTRTLKQDSEQNVHLKQENESETGFKKKQDKSEMSPTIPKQEISQVGKESKIVCLKSERNQKISMSKSTVVKREELKSDKEKEPASNSRIAETEQKLKQNALEQKQLKTVLSTLLTNQQKLEEQVRAQHQKEHLRLHQHFLIQEQLRQQSKGGKGKKEEILKLFVFQQQSLLTQQNTMLQCLRQNYLLEVQKVQTAIENLKKSHDATVKVLEAMKSHLSSKQPNSVIKSHVTSQSQASPSLMKTDTVKIVIKTVENPSVSQELKSPKKDHSIAAILLGSHGEVSQNRSNTETPLNVEKKLAYSLKSCESCQFLNGYGMQKKWCTKCEELKESCEGVKKVLAKTLDRVDTTFLEHANVPKVTNTPDETSDTLISQGEQTEPIYNYVLDLEIPDASEPVSEYYLQAGSRVEHTDHNYLKTVSEPENVSSELNTQVPSHESVESENVLSSSQSEGPTIPVSLSTSLVSSTSGVVNNLSITARTLCPGKVVTASCTKTMCDNSNLDERGCVATVPSNKPLEKVSFCLSDEVINRNNTTDCEDYNNDGDKSNINKHISGIKPVRSHSQSEIYDQKQKDVVLENPGVRHTRCHSHSELGTSEDQSVPDTDDISNNGTEVKGGAEDNVKTGKKRKLARCLSVPGWFGKGLNIKKRRRY